MSLKVPVPKSSSWLPKAEAWIPMALSMAMSPRPTASRPKIERIAAELSAALKRGPGITLSPELTVSVCWGYCARNLLMRPDKLATLLSAVLSEPSASETCKSCRVNAVSGTAVLLAL